MTNITYIFGAGASRQALPLVYDLPDRIDVLVSRLKTEENLQLADEAFTHPLSEYNKQAVQNKFIRDLSSLADKARNHASIDTLAKKLWLQGKDQELKDLKALLSVYFIFEQAINPADKRYDAFYASILSKTIENFPSNIKILSWNYDYQFEKSYSSYSENFNIDTNQSLLNVVSKYSIGSVKQDKFGIYKINGTTSIFSETGGKLGHFIYDMNTPFDKKLIGEVLRIYITLLLSPRTHASISFAWEDWEPGQNIVEKSITTTNLTDVLVVIGYSFPFFNRDIDRRIINSMTQLKKVYFQGPEPEEMKERFLAIRDSVPDNKLVLRHNTEQFLLPNEL